MHYEETLKIQEFLLHNEKIALEIIDRIFQN